MIGDKFETQATAWMLRNPFWFLYCPIAFALFLCLLLCWPTLPGWGWNGSGVVFVLNIFVGTAAILTIFASGIAFIVSLWDCIFKRDLLSVKKSVAALLVFSLGYAAAPLGYRVRHMFFERLAVRSSGLVRSLERYRQVVGVYPDTLQAMVPSIIPKVPHTGMLGYGPYIYSKATKETLFREYELMVSCGGLGINFDRFVYWPEQKYPKEMYGGVVELIGEWAYVHE